MTPKYNIGDMVYMVKDNNRGTSTKFALIYYFEITEICISSNSIYYSYWDLDGVLSYTLEHEIIDNLQEAHETIDRIIQETLKPEDIKT